MKDYKYNTDRNIHKDTSNKYRSFFLMIDCRIYSEDLSKQEAETQAEILKEKIQKEGVKLGPCDFVKIYDNT
jgi:hypothetical protein